MILTNSCSIDFGSFHVRNVIDYLTLMMFLSFYNKPPTPAMSVAPQYWQDGG